MINFRYYVVLIIGAFTALATGVVLGASLLQSRTQAGVSSSTTISAADPLLSAQADAGAAGLKALASSMLTGSLSSVKATLVVLPGASGDDVTATRSTLTDARASVVGRVTFTDNWQSTSTSRYHMTLSMILASHLASGAAKTASADGAVGYPIVQVLTTTGVKTDLLRQILTDKSTPIMTIDEDADGSATALVAVGPCAQVTAAFNTTSAAATSNPDAWVGLGQTLGSINGVFVGDTSARAAMTSQVRASGIVVTTVDSVGTALATVGTALALLTPATSARASGVGTGVQSVVPSVK